MKQRARKWMAGLMAFALTAVTVLNPVGGGKSNYSSGSRKYEYCG